RPETSVGNLVAEGRHTFAMSWLNWDVSGARSQMQGGSGGAKFKWNGAGPNCTDDPSATTDANLPQFSASCYTPGPTNVEDIANYKLTNWQPATVGTSTQMNLQGSASLGKIYRAGGQFGTIEFGVKVRNGRKDNNTYSTTYTVKSGQTVPIAQFAGSFTDPHYYDNSYPWPASNVDYTQVQNY